MTCRKVRRLIPLAAGDDLRPGEAAKFIAHVDGCPGCRRELEEFRAALAAIRTAAGAEGVADWSEAEWKAVTARLAAEAEDEDGRRTRAGAPAPMRFRWATAAAAGALLGLVVMGALVRGPSAPRGVRGGRGLAVASSERPRPGQDKLAVTMVSPETGLQVVWILDRNFEWKGEQE